MKFELSREKLEELLEKLYMNGAYSSSVITVKKKDNDTILTSLQRDAQGRFVRLLKVRSSYFNFIEADDIDTIEFDVAKLLKTVKLIRTGTPLTIETEGNKIKITGFYEDRNSNNEVVGKRKVISHISYREPDPNSYMTELPVTVVDGFPIVGKKKVKLDTKLAIWLPDLKEMVSFASTVDTEFYKFDINNGKLEVRIGDLHDFSDFWEYQPRATVVAGSDLSVIYTFGIKEIASTFRDDNIYVYTSTNSPAWIYEDTDDYTLGVLIPPFIQQEG